MDGNIALDECQSLDEVADMAATESPMFRDPDDMAMNKIADALAATEAGQAMSSDYRSEVAENLYAVFCHRVVQGQIGQAAIEKMAQLIGESADQLTGRLLN
jgi:hypothetical protein